MAAAGPPRADQPVKPVPDPAPQLRLTRPTPGDAPSGGAPDAADLFAILVREQAERLLAYLRASVPPSSVDDLFQEAVLVAWRRMGDYDRSRPFGAWMRGIARNLVMDHLSRLGRERPTDDALLDAIERRAELNDGADREEFRAQLSRLDECVAALPDEYRSVVHHCYRLDAPLARVAAESGASVEAIKKRLQRARAMIAACMERKGAIA